jgi:hypothetical protein
MQESDTKGRKKSGESNSWWNFLKIPMRQANPWGYRISVL